MLQGIDFHHAKPYLVKPEHDFVVLKASGGFGFIDPKFQDRARQAVDEGKRVMAYHFNRTQDSAQNQADTYLSQLDPVMDLIDAHWHDIEKWLWFNKQTQKWVDMNPFLGSHTAHMDQLLQWNEIVRATTGQRSGIYTNVGSWQHFFGTLALPVSPDLIPLWVANWGVDEPLIPAPWSIVGYTLWQYNILPIDGELIDHNTSYFKTLDDYLTFFTGKLPEPPLPDPPPPPPEPPPVPEPTQVIYIRAKHDDPPRQQIPDFSNHPDVNYPETIAYLRANMLQWPPTRPSFHVAELEWILNGENAEVQFWPAGARIPRGAILFNPDDPLMEVPQFQWITYGGNVLILDDATGKIQVGPAKEASTILYTNYYKDPVNVHKFNGVTPMGVPTGVNASWGSASDGGAVDLYQLNIAPEPDNTYIDLNRVEFFPELPMWVEVTNRDGLNVRKGPSTRADVTGVLHRGDMVLVVDYVLRAGDVWGVLEHGDVIVLGYQPYRGFPNTEYYTTWKMETNPPPRPYIDDPNPTLVWGIEYPEPPLPPTPPPPTPITATNLNIMHDFEDAFGEGYVKKMLWAIPLYVHNMVIRSTAEYTGPLLYQMEINDVFTESDAARLQPFLLDERR